MKKLAITLSLTTLLLGGLIGCGDADQEGARGLGGQDQRGMGYHTTDRDPENGITGQRAGEGPITDMFTRDDDQRGARGFGRDSTRQPATGLAGKRRTDQYGGMTAQDAGMKRTREQGGTGIGGAGGGMRGSRYGDAGARGLGDTGIGTRDDGGAGIVGDRPGYVDDRGILRRRDTNGRAPIGGLGQTGRTLQDNRTGMGRDGQIGRTGNRGTRGTGMNQFGYHTGYDGATVQRITTRLADVENVRDSRVIVDEDRILIGVDANGQDSQQIERDVRRTVENMVDDKEVIVVTERDQYNQVRSADDRLRGGEAFEEVGDTVNDMFRDFGRAIQRPFE